MRNIYLLVFSITVLSYQLKAQSVGINNDGSQPNPAAMLDIKSNSKGLLIPRMTNAQRAAINPAPQGLIVYQTDGVQGLYYQSSSIASIQNWYHLIQPGEQYWSKSLSGEHLYAPNTGNVGIGANYPDAAGLVVDRKIGAVNAMFGSNTTGVAIESNYPGIGFNSYYNGGRKTINSGYTGLVGFNPVNGNLAFYNSNTSTATDSASTIASRLLINNDGNIGVQGNTAPVSPLSFANLTGNKISLWGTSASEHYGLGIQGALLQVYTNLNTADIAFGFGSSTNFSENMRIKGNGYVGIGTFAPGYRLDVKGRMRLGYNNAETAGMWLNKQNNSEALFVGNINDTSYGIYSAATGWKFAFDHKNARLGLGVLSPKTALSFPASLGKKISLYPGNTGDAGFGVFGNELRMFSDYSGADITFGYDDFTNGFTERMRVKADGSVCIGTTAPAAGYMLNVAGKIISEEVRVLLKGNWPDYVFEQEYKLRSLHDVEQYINRYRHLPEIPSAEEVKKDGHQLGDIQLKLLQKIEELTLYLIDADKKNKALEERISRLEQQK